MRIIFSLGQRRSIYMRVLFVAMAIMLIWQLCINIRPVAAQEYGKIITIKQVPGPERKTIWFVQITGPGGIVENITAIEPCKWYRVVYTDPDQPCFTPPYCSWWHIFYPDNLYCTMFHVSDRTGEPHEFHIDQVIDPIVVDPPVEVAKADWFPDPYAPLQPIEGVWPCKWFEVVDPECFAPPKCSWWHIIAPPELESVCFHVATNPCPRNHMFHIDKVCGRGPIVLDQPVPEAYAEWIPEPAVGGVLVPVDKFGLLAPYIGLASTILVATAATAIYVNRVNRRKEKQ